MFGIVLEGKKPPSYNRRNMVLYIFSPDPEFCSFLQSSNTRLLQSFVTSVVEKERIRLTEKTDLT